MNNPIWLGKTNYDCSRMEVRIQVAVTFSFKFSIRNSSGGGRDNNYKLVHKTEPVNWHKQMIKFDHPVPFHFLVHLKNSGCLPHSSQNILCFWSMLLGISPNCYLPDRQSTTDHSHQCTCCSSWLTEQMSSYISAFHCNQKKC